MVLEGERTVASVAREFGINASTLGSRVHRHRIVQDEAADLSAGTGPDPGAGAGERRAAREAGVLEKAAFFAADHR
ncbi:hypothetical protein [Nonomuraea sp. NPDC049400]|uniref:hypothetical protein n=1 Tax=Nonomuraea sp. NPDC049400 TaxID=3364352 RepID=UPI00379C40AC